MVFRRCLSLLAFATTTLGGAADDANFIGAEACAGCHAAQSRMQAQSSHSRSLRRAAAHPLASAFANSQWLDVPPGFRLRYRLVGEQVRAQAYDSRNTMDIPVEWAFGAGEQAVTLVTRIDKDWHLEHRFSYYKSIGGMGLTAGHSAIQPKTLQEAIGLPYKTLDPNIGILGCFECHSTGPVRVAADNVLQPRELGVRCEACHGPGREHAQAARNGKPGEARLLIRNPKRGPAGDILEKCGRCHRPPAGPRTQIDWSYAWNVRHQPVYLAQSRCMTRSQGRLSCLTCHDAHAPLSNTTSTAYNERCQSCHSAGSCTQGSTAECTTCHMPKVAPQEGLRFTNHWIGVYATGSLLKPR